MLSENGRAVVRFRRYLDAKHPHLQNRDLDAPSERVAADPTKHERQRISPLPLVCVNLMLAYSG